MSFVFYLMNGFIICICGTVSFLTAWLPVRHPLLFFQRHCYFNLFYKWGQ
jgi:hypothetical protein